MKVHCSVCDSTNLEGIEADYPTGVCHPDGGWEYRRCIGYKCRDCGALEEL